MRIKKEMKRGTIRFSVNGKTYEKKASGWKVVKKSFPELQKVVALFKAHNRLKDLIDTKDPHFLKGQLSPDGQPQGARITILPNGEKLEKAFSLFAPHLQIHDQTSHDHWDVLYQNKGGTWSYVYTLKKRRQHQAQKYKKVEEFEKVYGKLMRNVTRQLRDEDDYMAIPMYTLLRTYMRVGNEIYYKAHGHRGLTTLARKNISIKDNVVTFRYKGKDGIPILISQKFSNIYIRRLRSLLNVRKKEDFVFSKEGMPLHEYDFKHAFLHYCGREFYPHIVRSHYATMKVKKYCAGKRKITKEEIEKLFWSIAHNLGHKKFNKKKREWQEHYRVTVNSYVQPELLEKVYKIVV